MTAGTPHRESGQQVPAGWYPDPKMVGTQRYWDGSRWTEHAAPLAHAALPPPDGTVNSTLEMWGWLGAFFLTPVGFVIGIIIASKGGRAAGRGAAMIAVSVGMTVGALVLIQISAEQEQRELEEQILEEY
jgi:hypothetical protein